MQTVFWVAGGVAGMGAALLHMRLGDAAVRAGFAGGGRGALRVMRAVMALSGLYWFAGAAALALAPALPPEAGRIVALVVAALFASGAAANLWALRGRHFGAPVLGLVALLALGGVI